MRVTHFDNFIGGPASRVVLAEIPLLEFRGQLLTGVPGTFNNDMQKLVQLAAENRRQREAKNTAAD